MGIKICQKCSKMIQAEACVCPHCREPAQSVLLHDEPGKASFNFTVLCISTAFLSAGGLLLGVVQQNAMIALGSILGFWVLIYLYLWLMCAVDCFQEKDGTGFLFLLLLPVIGMILVIAVRER